MHDAVHASLVTSLYYTFSTIAQALAAAMALLAALAMYRLKALNDEARDAGQLAQDITGGGYSLRSHFIKSDWRALVLSIGERQKATHGANDDVTVLKSRIERLATIMSRVQIALWVSLAVTAIVLISSVAVLASVPHLRGDACAVVLLRVGVIATSFCILVYCWLLFEALRR
jgi:hypothetical protein